MASFVSDFFNSISTYSPKRWTSQIQQQQQQQQQQHTGAPVVSESSPRSSGSYGGRRTIPPISSRS